jgi:hypothetical protein
MSGYSSVLLPAGDGLFCVARALAAGVKVGLGTDVAGGYSPSMLQAIRLAVVNSHALKAATLMAQQKQDQQQQQEPTSAGGDSQSSAGTEQPQQPQQQDSEAAPAGPSRPHGATAGEAADKGGSKGTLTQALSSRVAAFSP